MGFSLIICGIGARFVADDLVSDEAKFKWACTVAFGIFLYTACFGATWLVPPWLYPTEVS